MVWKPIETVTNDGRLIFDVWLGNASEEECALMLCAPGTKRSPNWHWHQSRVRPRQSFSFNLSAPTIAPTHWMEPGGDQHGEPAP
jgi:hypothetical protein